MISEHGKSSQLPTAEEVVSRLQLQPHPEGGWFRELHRGASQVTHEDGRSRSTGTLIYFLLGEQEAAGWHVVASDEYWVFVDGAPMELHQVGVGDAPSHEVTTLGRPSEGLVGAHTIAANNWQAARTLGVWTLVSCAVAPGFDFADFHLLASGHPEYEALARLPHPQLFLPTA